MSRPLPKRAAHPVLAVVPMPARARWPRSQPDPLPVPITDPEHGRPLRPAAAIACEVSEDGIGGEFDTARERILEWVETRTGPLPESFAERRQESATSRMARFECGGARVEAVDRALGRGRYFGLLLESGSAPEQPVSRVRAAIFRSGGGTHLRMTLEAPRRFAEGLRPMAWTPRVVHDLIASPGLIDYGWRIVNEPWVVDDEESVEGLIHLIADPARTRPVFATGLSGAQTDPEACSVDPWDLALRTAGLAHVVVLTGPMTYVLSDRVGRRFSVFGDAFRTYRPGRRILEDARAHPIALSDTVREWPDGGPRRFALYLAREAARMSLACQMTRSGWGMGDMIGATTGIRLADVSVTQRVELPVEDGGLDHPVGTGTDAGEAAEPARLRAVAGAKARPAS